MIIIMEKGEWVNTINININININIIIIIIIIAIIIITMHRQFIRLVSWHSSDDHHEE